MALCSLSTGRMDTPYSFASGIMIWPAVTRVSLFASAMVFFALMAAIVGRMPSIPTIAAELGNSNIVSRGASVIALEANYAILTGLVTSTTNELSAQDNNYSVLTTDIASNKLQSGILINTDGQVIGLSLQDFNPAEENNTLTAVSISDLSPAIEKLESGADVPYIGITCTTVTEKIANRYNIPKGVYIKQVTMDSPAFVSGLQSGDVIVAVNNTEVSNVSAYNTQLMKQKPEDTCNLKVKRKGSNGYTEITCQVKIGVMN